QVCPVDTFEALADFLDSYGAAEQTLRPSWSARIVGALTNKLVWWLDGLGVRMALQKHAQALLPPSWIEFLKRAR
ncbi:MAG: hypothetical protein GX589_05400, partial [Deltaproteobacteria bacterium]|nr:hypothetical protein [Deltaproteobacteria bacterium]